MIRTRKPLVTLPERHIIEEARTERVIQIIRTAVEEVRR